MHTLFNWLNNLKDLIVFLMLAMGIPTVCALWIIGTLGLYVAVGLGAFDFALTPRLEVMGIIMASWFGMVFVAWGSTESAKAMSS